MLGATERAPTSVQSDVSAIRGHETVRKVLLAAGVLSRCFTSLQPMSSQPRNGTTTAAPVRW
jgi:hypothetical protein